MLSEIELKRYERQIRIFGEEGQERLKRRKVFIAGAGGLGSAVSIYIAAAGVGRMKIVDHDDVELSNLNRQILHWVEDIGSKKVESAEKKLNCINPDLRVEAAYEIMDDGNIADLVGDSDLIIDALDNMRTRYLLNKCALSKRIPLFHGAVSGFNGQATSIIPGKTACLRCIFPKAQKPMVAPVVGTTCGIIGCVQATEAIKYMLGLGELLENRLLLWDGSKMRMEEIALERDPGCVDCGQSPKRALREML